MKLPTTYFYLLVFMMISCKTQQNQEVPKQFLREWKMINFKSFEKESLINLNAGIQFANPPEKSNSFSANMGCNQIFAKVEFMDNNRIRFSGIETTEKFCENKMRLEKDFVHDLTKMRKYKVEGHFLTLSDGKEIKMRFIASDWD